MENEDQGGRRLGGSGGSGSNGVSRVSHLCSDGGVADLARSAELSELAARLIEEKQRTENIKTMLGMEGESLCQLNLEFQKSIRRRLELTERLVALGMPVESLRNILGTRA